MLILGDALVKSYLFQAINNYHRNDHPGVLELFWTNRTNAEPCSITQLDMNMLSIPVLVRLLVRIRRQEGASIIRPASRV